MADQYISMKTHICCPDSNVSVTLYDARFLRDKIISVCNEYRSKEQPNSVPYRHLSDITKLIYSRTVSWAICAMNIRLYTGLKDRNVCFTNHTVTYVTGLAISLW